MKLLISVALLFLTACGPIIPDPRNIKQTDPAFTKYIGAFEYMYGRSIGDIPIGFTTTLDGTFIGMCTVWSTGYRQIEIDQEYWNSKNTSELNKIGLIFHELGHCVLNRGHIKDKMKANMYGYDYSVPVSIMYPYNFFSDFYKPLEDYYMEELFTSNRKGTPGVYNQENMMQYKD